MACAGLVGSVVSGRAGLAGLVGWAVHAILVKLAGQAAEDSEKPDYTALECFVLVFNNLISDFSQSVVQQKVS